MIFTNTLQQDSPGDAVVPGCFEAKGAPTSTPEASESAGSDNATGVALSEVSGSDGGCSEDEDHWSKIGRPAGGETNGELELDVNKRPKLGRESWTGPAELEPGTTGVLACQSLAPGHTWGPYLGGSVTNSCPGQEVSLMDVLPAAAIWLRSLELVDNEGQSNCLVFGKVDRLWCSVIRTIAPGDSLLAYVCQRGSLSPKHAGKQAASFGLPITQQDCNATPVVLLPQQACLASVLPTAIINKDLFPCKACGIWYRNKRNLQAHLTYYCAGRLVSGSSQGSENELNTNVSPQNLVPSMPTGIAVKGTVRPTNKPSEDRPDQASRTEVWDTTTKEHGSTTYNGSCPSEFAESNKKTASLLNQPNAAPSKKQRQEQDTALPGAYHSGDNEEPESDGGKHSEDLLSRETISAKNRKHERSGGLVPTSSVEGSAQWTASDGDIEKSVEISTSDCPNKKLKQTATAGTASPRPQCRRTLANDLCKPLSPVSIKASAFTLKNIKAEPHSPTTSPTVEMRTSQEGSGSPASTVAAFPHLYLCPVVPLDGSAGPAQASEVLARMSELAHQRLQLTLTERAAYTSSYLTRQNLSSGDFDAAQKQDGKADTHEELEKAERNSISPKHTTEERENGPPLAEVKGNPHENDVLQRSCGPCNIIFNRHETFLVHKQYYCATRHDPPPRRAPAAGGSAGRISLAMAGRARKRNKGVGTGALAENQNGSTSVTTSSDVDNNSPAVLEEPLERTTEGAKRRCDSSEDSRLQDKLRRPSAVGIPFSTLPAATTFPDADIPIDLSKKANLYTSGHAGPGSRLYQSPLVRPISIVEPQRLSDYHKCASCQISFSRLDNYLAHKQYYCSATTRNTDSEQYTPPLPSSKPWIESPNYLTPVVPQDLSASSSPRHLPGEVHCTPFRQPFTSSTPYICPTDLRLQPPDMKPVVCPYCPGAVVGPEALIEHLALKHGMLSVARGTQPSAIRTAFLEQSSSIVKVNERNSPNNNRLKAFPETSGKLLHTPPAISPAETLHLSTPLVPAFLSDHGDVGPPPSPQTSNTCPSPVQPCVAPSADLSINGSGNTSKYCRLCDIQFSSLSNFIAHKKFYCASHAGERHAVK
uniref:zinc finger protein ZFPM1-like n=1 Tax=Myxine glutinosa TaxID=7769 RepID=UPI00358E693C